jgi:NodT family efflux transporter outer membrane factor (OMF) lipoprotein
VTRRDCKRAPALRLAPLSASLSAPLSASLLASLSAALSAALLAALLTGCAAGPDYQRPEVAMPPTWTVEAPFRLAQPDDAAFKGAWWQRFGDAQLDELQRQALAGSPTLAIANARLLQARAALAGTEAQLWPQLGLNTRAARQRTSANRPLSNYATPNFSTIQNDFVVSMAVNYEVDLAGRVQRASEGAAASAEQAAADLQNTRLVLASDLATAYFNLRSIDTELQVVQRSIALQRRSLQLVSDRHELGAASGVDVAQQQALLDSTQVQVELLQRQRRQYEHALATLVGVPAPQFALAPVAAQEAAAVPAVPLGLPSDLLERRPDIAAAERAVAAANAQIGVARAAFFPSIVLGPSVGEESRVLSRLFDAPSLLWSLGVSVSQVLVDNGRLQANVEVARAGQQAAAASYRRVVLTAMQEVEDGITGLAALQRASARAGDAVASARRVLDMATARYEGGATGYLDVINAQQSLLTAERQVAQLDGQRRVTTVFLVKALGGDWAQRRVAASP